MNRFCIRHSHRGYSRAYRMVYACVVHDRDLLKQVADEHDGCAQCWQDTAVAAVEVAADGLISGGPLPEWRNGLVEGEIVDWLLRIIDRFLQAEEVDRRDIGL